MKELELIEIGTEVLLNGGLPAKVSAVTIRGIENFVAYECVWWNEGERKVDWIPSVQVAEKDVTVITNSAGQSRKVRFK